MTERKPHQQEPNDTERSSSGFTVTDVDQGLVGWREEALRGVDPKFSDMALIALSGVVATLTTIYADRPELVASFKGMPLFVDPDKTELNPAFYAQEPVDWTLIKTLDGSSQLLSLAQAVTDFEQAVHFPTTEYPDDDGNKIRTYEVPIPWDKRQAAGNAYAGDAQSERLIKLVTMEYRQPYNDNDGTYDSVNYLKLGFSHENPSEYLPKHASTTISLSRNSGKVGATFEGRIGDVSSLVPEFTSGYRDLIRFTTNMLKKKP